MTPFPQVRMATCHPTRRVLAKGLCRACYDHVRRREGRRKGQSPPSVSRLEAMPWSLRELLALIATRTVRTVSCHLWQGSMSRRRPPSSPVMKLRRNGVLYSLSPRTVVYLATYGPPPAGKKVRTSCGVERCLREDHLKLATSRDWGTNAGAPVSIPDAVAQQAYAMFQAVALQCDIARALGVKVMWVNRVVRGKSRRQATGMRGVIPGGVFRSRWAARGERHGQNKLTWQEVLMVIGLQKAGYTGQRLAENFGVSPMTISRIGRGKAWQWLTRGLTDMPPQVAGQPTPPQAAPRRGAPRRGVGVAALEGWTSPLTRALSS